jgi:opine dehydrogenase
MIVVPANAHRDLALRLAPLLEDGQIIVLNPGRTFGALEFRQVLAQAGCPADVVVAEAQTFIFASRADGPAQAHIFRTKEWVALAAYPAQDTSRVLAALNPAYPQFRHGRSVLHTGLNNIGAIFHPAILLLNTGWIEATQGGFEFYFDGVTPTVARIMEAVDRERLSLGAHLGVQLISARDWLFQAYHAQGEDLYTAILDQEGYRGIFAPGTMDHRYLHEDIPMSLVPLASLGQHLGVPVNAMQSLIHLANLAHHTDYEQIGRTVASLGLQSLSGPHIRARLEGLPTPSYKLNDPPRPKLPQETGLAENGHQPVHRVQTPLLD